MLFVAIAASIVSSTLVNSDRSSGCGKGPKFASTLHGEKVPGTWREDEPGQDIFTLSDGQERSYRIAIPREYDPNQAYPLVFGFHGWRESGLQMSWYDGFDDFALEGKLISVHPDGLADIPETWRNMTDTPQQRGRYARTRRSWNAMGAGADATPDTCQSSRVRANEFPCCESCKKQCSPCNWASCADEITFIDELLTRLEEGLCIDRTKIRAHGTSNGGMMVLQLMQSRLAHRFDALVGQVALPAKGTLQVPQASVRFMGIWGKLDVTMPPIAKDGGEMTISDDGFYYSSAVNLTKTIRLFNQPCEEPINVFSEITTDTANPQFYSASCYSTSCSGTSSVTECMFEGTHDWPYGTTALIRNFYDGRHGKDINYYGRMANASTARPLLVAHAKGNYGRMANATTANATIAFMAVRQS